MNVYEFEKSLLERMEESRNVLQCKGAPVPAVDVREEWACHVELKIEPAGWQAIWKINRATCEKYKIKYPTVVLGTVNNVYFQDLIADFSISMVQDDNVHLPEIHEVPLEDLWPTIDQENTELNIERTADCIDELRFFYRNVWMPWDSDSDDEADWCKKHLESRIRFCFDLKRDMGRGMADHIRKLIAEARYIQNKRELMESEMSDDEDAEEDPQKVEDFMRMQLRMIEIRNQIEMLENPVIRKTYESINFKVKQVNNNDRICDETPNVYIVTKEDTITKQMEYFDAAKKMIGADVVVKFVPTLMDCLKVSASYDHIYLPIGRHDVKLLMPLNSGGRLKAVPTLEQCTSKVDTNKLQPTDKSIVTTEQNDNLFLSFNGDYAIENVVLDCRHVLYGLWIKSGTVILKNCLVIGDNSSSTNIGIFVTGEGKCVLENTKIQNFAVGITCCGSGKVTMNQTAISDCEIGFEIEDTVNIQITSCQISNSKLYAVLLKTKASNVFDNKEKRKIVQNFDELRKLIPLFEFNSLDCILNDNKKGEIAVVDQKNYVSLQHSEFLEENFDESGFKNTDMESAENRMDVSV